MLQDIVRAYNHTRHSIRMQPATVTRENARIARENMERRRGERVKGASKVVEQKAKFDVNDLVRVSRAKATFEKGSAVERGNISSLSCFPLAKTRVRIVRFIG
ncbi:hypothetical protein P5V15_015768 [Pogonomyrmex californicus]